MDNIERRSGHMTETRVSREGGKTILRGYAAMFGSLSQDLGGFREIVTKGAFRSALLGSDARALFNHEPDLILGRQASGTLRLKEDERGLHFEVDLPPTTYAQNLIESIRRGDVNGCSFGFSIRREGGDSWQKDAGGSWIRTIVADGIEKLHDISACVFPAYESTYVSVEALRHIQSKGNSRAFIDRDVSLSRLRLELALPI